MDNAKLIDRLNEHVNTISELNNIIKVARDEKASLLTAICLIQCDNINVRSNNNESQVWTQIGEGASVAQWSERSPFTSKVVGLILNKNFLNVTRAHCSTHVKRVCQYSAESRGFSPGTPVSLTGWVRINTVRKVNVHCCKNS